MFNVYYKTESTRGCRQIEAEDEQEARAKFIKYWWAWWRDHDVRITLVVQPCPF